MSTEPEKPTLESYAQWLTRFKQVWNVCNSPGFPPNKMIGYQLYLLDFGQVNANFELAELLRLKYPLSPFIPTSRHAYIRSTDTWAMQLLSNLYRQSNTNAKTVWFVDSENFWFEFERYTKPTSISSLNTDYLVESVCREGGFLTAPLWITMDNLQQLELATWHTERLKSAIATKEIETVNPVLQLMFTNIINGIAATVTDEMLQALKEMFPKVHSQISEHRSTVNLFTTAIKAWLEEKKNSKVQIAFYYKETNTNLGRQALVICEHVGQLQSFKSVLDNLGYRMEPIKAIRLVLRTFQKLFFDDKDTGEFFRHYFNTKVFTSLTADERRHIRGIKTSIIDTIRGIHQPCMHQLYTINDITCIQNQLTELPKEWSFYYHFVERCLQTITINSETDSCDTWFLNVAIPELKDVLESLRTSCSLTQVVRHTQRVSEVLLLFFETFQPRCLLSEIVTTEYFRDFSVQGVSLTPYAMRAFARVFQLIDEYPTSPEPLRVSVTAQSYYEWLQNLDRLDPCKVSVLPVQHLNDADPNSDVFFVEIHPNNVAAAKQFAHDVNGLVQRLSEKDPKQRSTLVIDITLNALNDEEVNSIIVQALQLINDGRLNLIVIQSLTKFSQLGLDKRSAGLFIMLNNNDDHWKDANKKLKVLEEAESVDDTTLRFFSYFYQCADDLRQYIKIVNCNTRYVYDSVMRQLDQLEVLSRECFQLTLSSDHSACYIALNASGWVGIVNQNFRLKEKEMETFLVGLLKGFIHPLCHLLNLSLTERMSIGFPLSSVNVVFDSLRITIGLESEEELNHYTDVFAFVAFVLNRIRKPEFLLNDDFRNAYFLEKVNQFSVMTSRQSMYCVTYDTIDSNSFNRFLKRRVCIEAGVMKIVKEESNRWVDYDESEIKVRVRGDENETRFDTLSVSSKRMLVACFTQILNPDGSQANESNQCVKITFDNMDNTLCIESMEMLSNWNIKRMYGPFPPMSAYFYLHHMNISYRENVQDMDEKEVTICIKQGSMCFPLLEMPLEDREFLFSEGAYTSEQPHSQQIDMQYNPKGNHMQVKVERNTIEIERDLICVSIPGVTVFHRFLDDQLSYFEIDYWSIKDPLLARFMRLMTAVYVKEFKQIEFAARDKRLTHFIMKLDFQQGKKYMAEATEVVHQRRHLLCGKLLECSNTHNVEATYSFSKSSLQSPSGKTLVDCIKNPALIKAAYELLKPVSSVPSSSAALPP